MPDCRFGVSVHAPPYFAVLCRAQHFRDDSHGTFAVIEAKPARLDASPAVPRRRWLDEAKARILEEAMTPSANVSAVAHAHDVSPQQVFAWRRKAIRSGATIALLPESYAFVSGINGCLDFFVLR